MWMILSWLFLVVTPVWAADLEIDRLLLSPIGKDWVTNGGNLTNQRYSTLEQINASNVKQLKGAWMTRLKGSGLGAKYSFEATPLVKDGIMYLITGNDDVFALNAKTGKILWQYWSGIAGKRALCCGWANRGLAMGEGLLFFGQLDATVVALDMKTGEVVWKTPIEHYEHGYSITSAPLYYNGIVYSGISGGEYGYAGASPPWTPRPAPSGGGPIPCRGPATSAAIPGRPALTMRCVAGRRSGTPLPSTRNSGSSISRRATVHQIMTGRCATGITCSAPR
jgi:hypothetical protein